MRQLGRNVIVEWLFSNLPLQGDKNPRKAITVRREPDLILLGHGVGDTLQLTVEAQRILARFGKAYCLPLPPNLKRFLRSQRVECVDLSDHFQEDKAFADVYLELADYILTRCIEEKPVILLTQGNPLFLNSLTRFLFKQATERKLAVQVIPGLSQLDTIISDIGLDVGTFGVQIFDARRFVERQLQPNPDVPLLLLQLGGFTASRAGQNRAEPDGYGPLAACLSKFYPADHPLTLLNAGHGKSTRVTVTVARFAELIPQIGPTSSLFLDLVPAGKTATRTARRQVVAKSAGQAATLANLAPGNNKVAVTNNNHATDVSEPSEGDIGEMLESLEDLPEDPVLGEMPDL
jgi:Tetrapyrrole (Corrin/Porphyrin) Methylases